MIWLSEKKHKFFVLYLEKRKKRNYILNMVMEFKHNWEFTESVFFGVMIQGLYKRELTVFDRI